MDQEFANIRFEIHCPNESDCMNEGYYQEAIAHDIYDDDTGQVLGQDWEFDIQQCQFCFENPSSIYRGGTDNLIDLTGIAEYGIKPRDIRPVEINIDGHNCESFQTLESMHGNHIAIFKVVNTSKERVDYNNEDQYSFEYEYFNCGFCLGDRIFLLEEEKQHLIDLDSFKFFYIPGKIVSKDATLRWSLRVNT